MPLFRNKNKKLERIKEAPFGLEKEIQRITEKNLNKVFNKKTSLPWFPAPSTLPMLPEKVNVVQPSRVCVHKNLGIPHILFWILLHHKGARKSYFSVCIVFAQCLLYWCQPVITHFV